MRMIRSVDSGQAARRSIPGRIRYKRSSLRLWFLRAWIAEMPVWGPIFQDMELHNEAAVRQRIKNLMPEYLESIQQN